MADAIHQHHERIDGTGYPNNLRDKDILIEAKILAAGDVLEAITNHRPYRQAKGILEAKRELKAGAGLKYDKEVVNVILDLLERNGQKPFWTYS